MQINYSQLMHRLMQGNKAALAKAITLVEKSFTQVDEVNKFLQFLPETNSNAKRIAISGVPGAGKSTLIESLGMHCIQQGKKVAVLAIDPSSAVTKGSILGDKTRMPELSANPNSFVRPTPNSGWSGGIAPGTLESILLCEAVGYEVILIETVGVGQSEFLAQSISDIFVFIALSNTGDELQGLKKGIMESIDLCFVNKADLDLPNFKFYVQELRQVFHGMRRNPKLPMVNVLSGSATSKKGIKELWEAIESYFDELGQEQIVRIRENKTQQISRLYLKELVYHELIKTKKITENFERIPVLQAVKELNQIKKKFET